MSNPLLDAFTRHQIYLQRFASKEANTFEPFLREADKIIRDVLTRQGEFISDRSALVAVEKELREKLGGVYGDYVDVLLADLEELSESEVNFTAKTLEQGTDASIAAPAIGAVWAAVLVRPMSLGGTLPDTLKPFLSAFTRSEAKRVTNIVRSGFFERLPVAGIIRQVRGTKANQFKDGALNTTNNNASTVAKTAVNHTAVQSRNAVYARNSGPIDAVEWSSVLDSRTSNVCRHLDGEVFPVDSGPRPPAHPNCRSQVLPVVSKESEIYKGSEQRTAKGAEGVQKSGASQYYNWLATQPASFQDEVLGKTKGKLFRNGGLSNDEFRRLVSNNFGEPLTLDEIKRKDREAWNDANL